MSYEIIETDPDSEKEFKELTDLAYEAVKVAISHMVEENKVALLTERFFFDRGFLYGAFAVLKNEYAKETMLTIMQEQLYQIEQIKNKEGDKQC